MSFVIAALLSLVLTPIAGRIGEAVGLVDRPDAPLKIHARPIPVLGGVAVVVAASIAAAASGHEIGEEVWGAAALLVAVGLIDDARPLSPYVQLAAQALAGVLLVAGGARLVPLGALDRVAVVLLVVALANAMNMIDGQDGLCGGLAAIGCLGIVAVAGSASAGELTLVLALAGALCSFVVWNRPPARIFLGNSGPQAIAVIIVAGIASSSALHGWRGLLSDAVCLGVFAFELVFTVIRRLGSGQLMRGDRRHSYDLLALELGSRAQVTLAFWGLGAVCTGLAVVVATVPLNVGIALVVVACAAAVVLGRALWMRFGAASGRGTDTYSRPVPDEVAS